MDKNYLLETAKKLKQVSKKSAGEYNQSAEKMVVRINTLMLERPDILNLVSEDNVNMMKDNHSNHTRFIGSVLENYNPEVLVDTVLWVFRAYRSHGFSSNYWAAQMNAWITIIKEDLSPETYAEIFPLYKWMQINIPIFVKVSDEHIEANKSLH